jgi:GTP-binding protein
VRRAKRPTGRKGDKAKGPSIRPTSADAGHRPIAQSADRPIALSAFAALPIEFVGSFPDPLVPLAPVLPEVALIGRSNVGKSSLLNALTGRPGLARVSGTPGKTTLLNAFRLPEFYLVDLPGYGWARAGKTARAGYRRLVDRYLLERPTLAGVVWLLDVRHDPSKEDWAMQELLVRSGRPVLVALTKGDKLTRSAQAARPRELAAALGLREDQVQLTSSTARLGITDLADSIIAAVGDTG